MKPGIFSQPILWRQARPPARNIGRQNRPGVFCRSLKNRQRIVAGRASKSSLKSRAPQRRPDPGGGGVREPGLQTVRYDMSAIVCMADPGIIRHQPTRL